MAIWTLKAHTAATSSSGTGVTTPAINTTGANLLVGIMIWFSGAGQPTFNDNKGNTWTDAAIASNNGVETSKIIYVFNGTVGSNHIITLTGGQFCAFGWSAWAGAVTSPKDAYSAAGAGSGKTSQQPGSISPAEDNELLISALTGGMGTVSVDSGYTISDQVPLNPGLGFEVAMAYLIETAKAAQNPTWSWSSGATSVNAHSVSFKAAPVAGAGLPFQARIIG